MATAYITTLQNQSGLVPCKSRSFLDTWLVSAMAFSWSSALLVLWLLFALSTTFTVLLSAISGH